MAAGARPRPGHVEAATVPRTGTLFRVPATRPPPVTESAGPGRPLRISAAAPAAASLRPGLSDGTVGQRTEPPRDWLCVRCALLTGSQAALLLQRPAARLSHELAEGSLCQCPKLDRDILARRVT